MIQITVWYTTINKSHTLLCSIKKKTGYKSGTIKRPNGLIKS